MRQFQTRKQNVAGQLNRRRRCRWNTACPLWSRQLSRMEVAQLILGMKSNILMCILICISYQLSLAPSTSHSLSPSHCHPLTVPRSLSHTLFSSLLSLYLDKYNLSSSASGNDYDRQPRLAVWGQLSAIVQRQRRRLSKYQPQHDAGNITFYFNFSFLAFCVFMYIGWRRSKHRW